MQLQHQVATLTPCLKLTSALHWLYQIPATSAEWAIAKELAFAPHRCATLLLLSKIDLGYQQQFLTVALNPHLYVQTLRRLLEGVKPTEIYNLGAQSHVRVSFDSPEYTVDTVGMGTLRLLKAIRDYQQRTGIEVGF